MRSNIKIKTALFAVGCLACLASAGYANDVEQVSRTLKGERLNELAVWDLGGDKVYEIFVSGVSGKAACYRADTLEPVWEKKLSNSALTAPVIGDFMGTGAPILAFGTSTGEVLFVWPATGQIISTLNTEAGYILAPAVVDFNDPQQQAVVLGDEKGQLIVADLSPDGLPRTKFTIPNTVSNSTAFSVVGQFSIAPSSADINHDGIPEVVIASESGILQVVSLTQPPTRHFQRLAQQSQATTLAAIGPLAEESASIVLGVNANLHVFQWQPDPQGALRPQLDTPAYGRSQGHILLAPVNADPVLDLVSSADNVVAARYMGTDLNGKQVFLDIAPRHMTTTAAPLSPAVTLTKPDGSTAIVSIDADGAVLEWLPTSPEGTIREVAHIPVPTGFTPAGNLTGKGKLNLVSWKEKGYELTVYTLPIDVSAESAPILTLGSNFNRNGQWGGDSAKAYTIQQDRAKAALEAAKALYMPDAPDSELTTTPASIIAGIAPNDPVAVTIADQRSRFTLKTIVLSLVLSLTGIMAIGLLWHYLRKRH